MTSPRVRFAPSPTGPPHVGNIRSALFNWLFARHHGGVFILRVEDTDQERRVPGSMEEMMAALRWLGLQWDEGPEVGGAYGPYLQSERVPLYQEAAGRLMEEGHAYRCFCTPERLEQMRETQRARGLPTGYDRRCRSLSSAGRESRLAAGEMSVVRFASPTEGETVVHDDVVGDVTFQHGTLDDFVLLKSDGFPTYHLANVVDDHLMEITHVLRAEEWLSSTPKHLLLWQAFGWEPPVYAHLPMVLGPDRKKLSKRHGPTGISTFREEGYLPEAMVNFLALLGWSPGNNEEILPVEEIIARFDLEGILKHPAVFDYQKLDWMNGVYMRRTSSAELAARVRPLLEEAGLLQAPLTGSQELYLESVVQLVQDRIEKLRDAPALVDYFFKAEIEYDSKAVSKWLARPEAARTLAAAADCLAAVDTFCTNDIEVAIRATSEQLGVSAPQVIHPVRVATTGRTVGPGLFETLAVLGKERVLHRLRHAPVSEAVSA
jgi:glutamyl-tRNA synthetase